MPRDIKERKCGCLYYSYGPPVLCKKHDKKSRVKEERALRALVEEQLAELGHVLTGWSEYGSVPGKWTAYCEKCGVLAIVYDKPPKVGDQINSWGFKGPCKKGELNGKES